MTISSQMKLRLEKIDKLIDKGFVLKTSLKGFFPSVNTPECKKVNIFSENFEDLSLPGFSWIAFIFPFAVAAQIRNWSFFWFVAILSFLCELFIAIPLNLGLSLSFVLDIFISYIYAYNFPYHRWLFSYTHKKELGKINSILLGLFLIMLSLIPTLWLKYT